MIKYLFVNKFSYIRTPDLVVSFDSTTFRVSRWQKNTVYDKRSQISKFHNENIELLTEIFKTKIQRMDFDDDDASVGSSFSSGDFPNDGDEGGFPSSTLCFIFSQYFLFRTSAARVRIFPERNDSFFFL